MQSFAERSMKLKKWVGVSLLCALFAANAFPQEMNYKRGMQNYQAVTTGQKKLSELSAAEQREVVAIARLVSAQDSSGDSEECADARRRAERAASELADYARRLRTCAESNDFTNDCSTEFRRVRSAQDDYESAVSSVSSDCR
jgi:hypothetical protein